MEALIYQPCHYSIVSENPYRGYNANNACNL